MRDLDKIVWSSTANHDYYFYKATDDEIRADYEEVFGEDFVLPSEIDKLRQDIVDGYLDDGDLDSALEWKSVDDDEVLDYYGYEVKDIDDMRSELANDEMSEVIDYDNLVESIAPEIERQCHNNVFWMVGNYQRWNGGHSAYAFFDDVEKGLVKVCYPNYDSTADLINDNGNLVFTEYTHDAPMGGTYMTLYSFKDADAWNAAEDWLNTEYTELDYEGNERHIPEYWGYEADISDVAEDADVLSAFIERGYLTPVSAKLW